MTELTHHAYYLEGPTADYELYAAHFRPFWGQKYERFSIDEARRLIELAALKNFKDSVFLIVAASIPTESQQALLKLFEEPQPGTHFVLVVPHGSLLPTLRSRMMEYPARQIPVEKVLGSPPFGRPDHFLQESAASFLGASRKERSEHIVELLKDDEGVREKVREF